MTEEQLARIRGDLELAAQTLREYENIHSAKANALFGCAGEERRGYEEAKRKAAANAALASRLEKTLSDCFGS